MDAVCKPLEEIWATNSLEALNRVAKPNHENGAPAAAQRKTIRSDIMLLHKAWSVYM